MIDRLLHFARRHRGAVAALVVAVVLLGWALLGLVHVASARTDAARAEASARSAVDLAASGDLEGARQAIADAGSSLEAAQGALRSIWVFPARLIPFVGTEVRGADAGIEAVQATSAAVATLLDFVLADRAPLYADGALDPGGLAALGEALDQALGDVAVARDAIEAAPEPRSALVGDRLAEADRVTADLATVLSGARPFVKRLGEAAAGGAPYRILLLLENAAERRGTGGFVGFIGLFEIDGDGIRLADLGSVVGRLQVRDEAGQLVAVEAPPDYVRRYGEFLANTTLWSNVNMSPDFPTVGDVARRLYQAATGTRADAVVRIDLVGLGYLLDAFPTVTIEGEPVDGEALATEFLIETYRRFPDDTRPGEQNAFLAIAMQEVFGQLVGGAPADRSAVLSAVQRAVAERRLAMHTGETETDAMLAALGAEGRVLPGGSGDLMVNALNFYANKIDIFTETEIDVSVAIDGCLVEGEVTLTLTNSTPLGYEFMPAYFGNDGRWMVSVYPPRGAAVLGLQENGVTADGTFLEEFGRTAVSLITDAAIGESASVTVRWQERLTEPGYTLTVQPQPLIIPATLTVNDGAPIRLLETTSVEFPEACR